MSEEHVQSIVADGIGHVVLNRPEKLNALTRDMYRRIGEILDAFGQDPEVRVVIFRGEGRAFSSGFDLSQQVEASDPQERRDYLHRVANANRWRIWRMEKPVIAALHGYCLAGALELILPCDFIVAEEDCKLGEPEVLFGTSPAFFMVPWVVNIRRAKQILLTGEYFSASQAADWGLITTTTPKGGLDNYVGNLAKRLAALPRPAVAMIKDGINRVYEGLGMQAHINGWVDSNLLIKESETEDTRRFKEIVRLQGVKEAVLWRDKQYE